jgi:hypothetical protein
VALAMRQNAEYQCRCGSVPSPDSIKVLTPLPLSDFIDLRLNQ